tara:strand:+ start:394 stop:1086 length:693 start_codon:yes stop_codon:yes gene_type:complete
MILDLINTIKFYNFLNIGIIDLFLIICFGSKARWFQLHAVINLYIVYLIKNDIYNIYLNPINGINKLTDHNDTSIIFNLHLYHIVMFGKLNFDEYIHHLLFVFLGVLPSYLYIKTNILKIGYLACCGLPGFIEYSSLTLVKNHFLNPISQKHLMIYIYNFIRLPLSLLGCFLNLMMYKVSILDETKKYNNDLLFFYINFLLYLNSTYYNYATINNFYKNLYRIYLKSFIN